jgi:tetratricopeptide (TPR) repeat protein
MVILSIICACSFGFVASYVFRRNDTLPGKLSVQLAYLVGYILMMGWALRSVGSLFGPFHDLMQGGMDVAGALLGLILCAVATILVITLCNISAIKCIVGAYVMKLIRFATSDDQLVVRKQYGRAAGAEARGDLDKAAQLYREEIEKDPKDADVHLLLAEVLLKQNLPNGALEEFQTGVGMMKEKRDRAAALFRLGEVFDEELNRPAAAREVADRIARECPGTPFAAHARKRWGS